jgi:hypothetical protein
MAIGLYVVISSSRIFPLHCSRKRHFELCEQHLFFPFIPIGFDFNLSLQCSVTHPYTIHITQPQRPRSAAARRSSRTARTPRSCHALAWITALRSHRTLNVSNNFAQYLLINLPFYLPCHSFGCQAHQCDIQHFTP